MKRTKCILLVFSMLFLCSCGNKENTASKNDIDTTEVTEQTVIETSSIITTISTKEKVTTLAEVTTVAVNESNEEYNQIFNAIECLCNKINYNYDKNSYTIFNGNEYITYDNEIDFFMAEVSRIKNSTLGEITDEQDLIAKSREIFIEILGQDFIERVEADYTIKNGVKLAIVERRTPIYLVEYCDEADIWYIYPCLPSGKLEDGTGLDMIYEWGAFLMVRGSDGEIVGCRF